MCLAVWSFGLVELDTSTGHTPHRSGGHVCRGPSMWWSQGKLEVLSWQARGVVGLRWLFVSMLGPSWAHDGFDLDKTIGVDGFGPSEMCLHGL